VGAVLIAGIQIIPVIASREAAIENSAFVLLSVASVPVLMFVVVALVYSALRFRANGDEGDGPAIHGHLGVQRLWLGISFLLVLGLFGYGATGLLDIRGGQSSDFEVQVLGEQWKWSFRYPSGVMSKELHVPMGERVHLVINSKDVIHSFWVPAFGIKQDAVPGRPTQAYLTATLEGTYAAQCAELCGSGHTNMIVTVIASSRDELDTWLASLPKPPPRDAEPSPSNSEEPR
jgi:cytochrome c oxidase subunit 2